MKKSFILYLDSLEIINEMDDVEVAHLFRAILNHVKGVPLELTKVEKIAFLPIKNYLDRDNTKWKLELDMRRQAGKLGGQARARNAKHKQAYASKSKQVQASQADSVSVNVSVNDSVNVNESDNNLIQENKKISTIALFEKNIDYVLNKSKEKYPHKNSDKALEDFLGYIKSKNTGFKDFYQAFLNWVRTDRFNQYNIQQNIRGNLNIL